MSSSPSSPDPFILNLGEYSLPVLDTHEQHPVTGDDEEEQLLDREPQSFESRAEETVVCFRLFLYNTELRFRPEYRPELCQLGTGRVEQ